MPRPNLSASEAVPEARGGLCAGHKIGVDANRPTDPRTGAIQPQVADPEVIASSGAGWVRLNFVVPPWSSPRDRTLRNRRTWAETYGRIVSDFVERGLRIYGLIGVEAMPSGPGNRFRAEPQSPSAEDLWLAGYVEQFCTIADMFHQKVQVFESFNEPDDWHGQKRNWVHPAWFAILLQRLYSAVRSNPALDRVTLVSGPLQGLQSNNNAAVYYLHKTYRAGKTWFGWGQPGVPFPFDGVGYHLYVQEAFEPDAARQERAIQATCRRYLDGMQRVIRAQEGKDKPLYVSELGWNSAVEPAEVRRREEFQARCLGAGLETLYNDPLVELGIWFCTQDFKIPGREDYYGLYRLGEATPEGRKPAFFTLKAICEQEAPAPPGTGETGWVTFPSAQVAGREASPEKAAGALARRTVPGTAPEPLWRSDVVDRDRLDPELSRALRRVAVASFLGGLVVAAVVVSVLWWLLA